MNAVAGIWRLVRERLQETQPEEFESWESFLLRLRRDVHWLNDSRCEQLMHLCTNKKERAAEILAVQGAKCK